MPGKKPASRAPRITRRPDITLQFGAKPIPIITVPQSTVLKVVSYGNGTEGSETYMLLRWILGPIFRHKTVEGGCKMVYGMKKTSVIID